MVTLAEFPSLQRLQAVLLGSEMPDSFRCESPGLEHLRCALVANNRTPLELAVLIRQALVGRMRPAEHRHYTPQIRLPKRPELPSTAEFEVCGCSVREQGDTCVIEPKPWRPNWLEADNVEGVDVCAAREDERRSQTYTRYPGTDPFLNLLSVDTYRTKGQATAVRAALSMPAGATMAISLPTGEGKSLVFQAIDVAGYGASTPGLTVVVVPTVTLAIDPETRLRAARRTDDYLCAFIGGEVDRNAQIVEQIGNQEQGVVFAAPEAVCGPLRSVLIKAAQAGRLDALVVDEAHLVEGWGTDFRTAFQSLAGLRRALQASAPVDKRLRTILLSATITQSAMIALYSLCLAEMQRLFMRTAQVIYGQRLTIGSPPRQTIRPERNDSLNPCAIFRGRPSYTPRDRTTRRDCGA